MLVLCVIFALLTVGLVVPCVIDIAMTPRHQLWDDVSGSWVPSQGQHRHPAARGAGYDHPFASVRRGRQAATARVRFVAPDDNPDFLLELDRRIRDWREGA